MNAHKTSLNFHGRFNVKSVGDSPLIALGENADKNELIKINIKSSPDINAASEEVRKSLFLIMGQFEFNLAPYPGMITTAANCGNEFKPVVVQFEKISAIRAFANQRLALSICKEDDYFYQLYTSYFYNEKEHQLISVDYYQTKNQNASISANKFFLDNFKELHNIDLNSYQAIIKQKK